MRSVRLDGYAVRADYYAEVFDRWVRIYGPPVAFPPRYGYGDIVWQSDYAKRFAWSMANCMKAVADRIEGVIPSNGTVAAFRQRVGACGVMAIYVRGRRYVVQTKQAERRMQEMCVLYALLGSGAIIQEMGAALGKNT